jgi:hypothetical protein
MTLEIKEGTRTKVHHVVGKGYTTGYYKSFKASDDYKVFFDKETGKPYQF